MIDTLLSSASTSLGLDAETLSAGQMALRALIVHPVGIAFVRAAKKRFIGKFGAFDVIMGIMIGSILSRAITGNSAFIATLSAALSLVALHYLFAWLSFHSEWFGNIAKGADRILVVDGEIQWQAMRRSHISEKDLHSALRENGRIDDVAQVKQARLERSGNISIIRRSE